VVAGAMVVEVGAATTSAAPAPFPDPPAHAAANSEVASRINAMRGADFTDKTVQPVRRREGSSP